MIVTFLYVVLFAGWFVVIRMPEEIVLVGAHYDTVAGCPGADEPVGDA